MDVGVDTSGDDVSDVALSRFPQFSSLASLSLDFCGVVVEVLIMNVFTILSRAIAPPKLIMRKDDRQLKKIAVRHILFLFLFRIC